MRSENRIVELAAWGFDESQDRDQVIAADDLARVRERAATLVQSCPEWDSISPVFDDATQHLKDRLSTYATRNDVQMEFEGLEWRLAVVDLRRLLSFQRRLAFPTEDMESEGYHNFDWQRRLDLAFPPPRVSKYTQRLNPTELTLQTDNPDFRVWLKSISKDTESFEVAVRHGSPFMEVADYRGRWFLRDGYHRAYRLLQACVFAVPAVVVHAKSLVELGAVQPWFFPEDILLGRRPPAVSDFMSDDLVLRWRRPVRRKVIRIAITEHFETMDSEEEKGAEREHCNQAR